MIYQKLYLYFADSFLLKKWSCGMLQSAFFDIGTFSLFQNWLIKKMCYLWLLELLTEHIQIQYICKSWLKVGHKEKLYWMKRGDVIGIIGIIASMIGHICRHLLQNSCFTFICKLIHIIISTKKHDFLWFHGNYMQWW